MTHRSPSKRMLMTHGSTSPLLAWKEKTTHRCHFFPECWDSHPAAPQAQAGRATMLLQRSGRPLHQRGRDLNAQSQVSRRAWEEQEGLRTVLVPQDCVLSNTSVCVCVCDVAACRSRQEGKQWELVWSSFQQVLRRESTQTYVYGTLML